MCKKKKNDIPVKLAKFMAFIPENKSNSNKIMPKFVSCILTTHVGT